MEQASTDDVAERYARFAAVEAKNHSEVYQRWAEGVAGDAELVQLISELPPDKRQPNIIFASARLIGAPVGPWQPAREHLVQHWDDVRAEALVRSTQTNEAARCAVLLPLWTELWKSHRRPLAVIEVGASAGLCLHPAAWRYRYVDRDGRELSGFGDGAELEVVVKSSLPVPDALPEFGFRTGCDLSPLDPTADADWLRTLVWPGQHHRLERLDHAIAIAQRDNAGPSPVEVVQGDLRDPQTLDALLAKVPDGMLPVVHHTAVLAYLEADDQAGFEAAMLERVADGQCHWISNEGQSVVPGVRKRVAAKVGFERSLRKGAFVVALDGAPRYQADGHASWIL